MEQFKKFFFLSCIYFRDDVASKTSTFPCYHEASCDSISHGCGLVTLLGHGSRSSFCYGSSEGQALLGGREEKKRGKSLETINA